MCTICKNSITLVYLRQIIYIGSYFNRMQDTRCLNKIDQPLIQNQQTQNNPAYKLQIQEHLPVQQHPILHQVYVMQNGYEKQIPEQLANQQIGLVIVQNYQHQYPTTAEGLRNPVMFSCPYCRTICQTVVTFEAGNKAWLCFAILCLTLPIFLLYHFATKIVKKLYLVVLSVDKELAQQIEYNLQRVSQILHKFIIIYYFKNAMTLRYRDNKFITIFQNLFPSSIPFFRTLYYSCMIEMGRIIKKSPYFNINFYHYCITPSFIIKPPKTDYVKGFL